MRLDLLRLAALAALSLALYSCAAIEIDKTPPPPTIAVLPKGPQADAAKPASSSEAPSKSPAVDLSPTTTTLNLTIEGALVTALLNNKSLKVEKFNPSIRQTFEAEERAVFDPTLTANLTYSTDHTVRDAALGGPKGTPRSSDIRVDLTRRNVPGGIALSEFFPTGTDVTLGLTTERASSNAQNGPVLTTRAGLSITQKLLQGRGLDVNLANLRQARIDTLSSDYELRGFTESLVSQVENAYWDYLYAQRQLTILEHALNVAETQANETHERIKVGTLANNERFAAESEVALRREQLINGRSLLLTTRLSLLRLISPAGNSLEDREVVIQSEPVLPAGEPDDLQSHLDLALRMRPDLNQARLAVKREDLEIVKTRNGLLPDLDLFITLGRTGYADSFGSSVNDLSGGSNDVAIGAQFSYPLGNRAPRARHARAMMNRDQGLEAVDNMAELVELDVRDAMIDINRIREQVAATAVTRELQESTLLSEQEKFRVGRSTSLLVAQAERDLLTARVNELQASVAYLKAFVALYRLDGSLLERRGVSCPGNEPVELPLDAPS